jgi:hypothetical protein
MKKLITKLLTISTLLTLVGCGSATMKIVKFDAAGNKTSEQKIRYIRVGSGELESVDIDIRKGKASIGSQKGSAGDMGEAFKNLTEVAKRGAGL